MTESSTAAAALVRVSATLDCKTVTRRSGERTREPRHRRDRKRAPHGLSHGLGDSLATRAWFCTLRDCTGRRHQGRDESPVTGQQCAHHSNCERTWSGLVLLFLRRYCSGSILVP